MLNPVTKQRLSRFRSIKRGYYSFLILGFFFVLALIGPLLVGNRAIVVKYNDQYYFPVFSKFIPGKTFGLDYDYETQYRSLEQQFETENKGNWVIMPPIPFGPKEIEESQAIYSKVEKNDSLITVDGNVLEEERVFSIFKNSGNRQREWKVVNGKFHGSMRGFDTDGDLIEKATYKDGSMTSYTNLVLRTTGFAPNPNDDELYKQNYFPTKPGLGNHWLGTDESGRDILARLFYGFRTICFASMIFLSFVYLIAVSIGCSMGYFGGKFDIIAQRFIEIWMNVPFLYIVIILSAIITPNLFWLMLIMVAFSWMALTAQMRTATYRERERDYVSAARIMGASTARIIFKHILPNTLSTIITFGPFLIAGMISSLTALDFLGFGLPPTEPSWGEMLKQGTDNVNAPWILASVFIALVSILTLITFIGEAIREAYDPKKFTTYK